MSTREREAAMSEAIVDQARRYDHFAPEFCVDPYTFWERLRTELPVGWSERHGGFHVVSRYRDVCQAEKDVATFSSADGVGVPPMPVRLLPIDTDPPQHRAYRRILNPPLGPSEVAAREDEARALAVELIEPLRQQAEFDLCAEFAVPFPQRVSLRWIGFPDADRSDLAKWIDDITRLRGIDNDRVAAASVAVMTRIMELVGERRSAPPRPDLVGILIDGSIEGKPLSDDEILFTMLLLLFGGLDTTSSAIAGAMAHLAEHPEQRQRLRDDPALLSTAVDEFLRYYSPVQGQGRTVTRDTTLGGCPLKAGDRVLLLLASGNRDETEFPDADQVVLDRHPNPHVAFGHGPHHCVGAHLGRLMVQVALEELLGRLGDVRIADPTRLEWVGGETRGLRTLPLIQDLPA